MELERKQLIHQINTLQKQNTELHRMLSALVASAGEKGITLSPESLTKRYEITRFDNPESLTITFYAKETD